MISELPHFSQDFCGGEGALDIISFHHLVSGPMRFLSNWGKRSEMMGHRFDGSEAALRRKW
jgi:hypothetical protein